MSENLPAKRPIGMNSHGVQLQSIEDAFRFSNAVIQSRMAPKGYSSPEQVMIAIQYGAEVGLAPMQALNSIAVIGNRPCLWGDSLPALVWGSGKCETLDEWTDGEGDGRAAHCKVKRKDSDSIITRSFSVADAKKANLWGKSGPWSQYPDRMLAMRARSFALRDAFADVLRGFGVAEEVRDVVVTDVTPHPEPVSVPDDSPDPLLIEAMGEEVEVIDEEPRPEGGLTESEIEEIRQQEQEAMSHE